MLNSELKPGALANFARKSSAPSEWKRYRARDSWRAVADSTPGLGQVKTSVNPRRARRIAEWRRVSGAAVGYFTSRPGPWRTPRGHQGADLAFEILKLGVWRSLTTTTRLVPPHEASPSTATTPQRPPLIGFVRNQRS